MTIQAMPMKELSSVVQVSDMSAILVAFTGIFPINGESCPSDICSAMLKITRRTTGARGYKFELFQSIF